MSVARWSSGWRKAVIWYALLGTMTVWMVHLVLVASLSRIACEERAWLWVMHAGTVLLGLAAAVVLPATWRLRRDAEDDEAADTEDGRIHFLALVGFLMSAAALALILAEGLFAAVVPPCD